MSAMENWYDDLDDLYHERSLMRELRDSLDPYETVITEEEAEAREWEKLLLNLTRQEQTEMEEPKVLGIRRAVQYENNWCCFREETRHRTTSTHKAKTLRTHRKGK
jgi:hypothetical protein